MHRAREKDTGRHVFRRHIGPPRALHGDLICWKCTAPCIAVGARLREGQPVQAHYRLEGRGHDASCPLDPDTVAARVARGSHGLAEVDTGGTVRLTLPRRFDDMLLPGPDHGTGPATEAEAEEDSVAPGRPLLPPAVATAAEIAQFLQLHDHEAEIAARFRVHPHQGRLIPWTDFCYGPLHESYTRLFSRLRTTPHLPHPVAVVGTVQRVSRDSNYSPFADLAVGVPSRAGQFHVTVRSDLADLMEPLAVGTDVLAVGGWEIYARGSTPALRLWVDSPWQLAFWHTAEDGTQTPPRCPARVTAAHESMERWRNPAPQPRPTSTPRAPAPTAQPPQAPELHRPAPEPHPPEPAHEPEPELHRPDPELHRPAPEHEPEPHHSPAEPPAPLDEAAPPRKPVALTPPSPPGPPEPRDPSAPPSARPEPGSTPPRRGIGQWLRRRRRPS